MPLFRKDALIPHVPLCGADDTGKRVRVSFTPAQCQHLSKRLRDMLSSRLQVPVAWEHQSRAKPMTQEEWEQFIAEKTRLTCGYLQDGQVLPDGTLELTFDIPDEQDAKDVAVIKYVSPEIVHDFVDGSGKKWPGMSITHLAVTPRPVQHLQGAVRRLSLNQHWPRCLRLSLEAHTMPDDYEDLPAVGDDVDEDTEVGEDTVDNDGGGGDSDEGKLRQLMEIMEREHNMVLSPHTTKDNLLDHLLTAAMTSAAHQGDAEGETPPEDEAMPEDNNVIEAPGSPVMLSLQKVQQKAEAMEQALLREHKKQLARRVAKIKSINPTVHRALNQELQTVQLSLNSKGQLATCPFLTRLTTAEQMAGGVRLSLPRGVVEADDEDGHEDRDKRSTAVADRLTGGAYSRSQKK